MSKPTNFDPWFRKRLTQAPKGMLAESAGREFKIRPKGTTQVTIGYGLSYSWGFGAPGATMTPPELGGSVLDVVASNNVLSTASAGFVVIKYTYTILTSGGGAQTIDFGTPTRGEIAFVTSLTPGSAAVAYWVLALVDSGQVTQVTLQGASNGPTLIYTGPTITQCELLTGYGHEDNALQDMTPFATITNNITIPYV